MLAAVLLFLMGIILILLNVKAIKKERQPDFKSLVEKKQLSINESQIEIGKLRKEFAETILELQQEINELKNEIYNIKNSESQNFTKQYNYSDATTKDELVVENTAKYIDKKMGKDINKDNIVGLNKEKLKSANSKIEQVKELTKQGKSTDQISNLLRIGKGEVLLIKELYLK